MFFEAFAFAFEVCILKTFAFAFAFEEKTFEISNVFQMFYLKCTIFLKSMNLNKIMVIVYYMVN